MMEQNRGFYREPYQESYQDPYQGGYQESYQDPYQGGYQESYQDPYQGGYQESYQDPYQEPYQETYDDQYQEYYEDYENGEELYNGGYGEENSFSIAGILKFAAAFFILVYIVLLLIYTSGSTKPFEEVAAAVEERLDTEKLVKQDAQALKRYYGLNGADYEGILFYSAEFSISAEEVLLIEVRSEQQVQEVRDAIGDRLESRRNTFEGYAPEQAQLIGQAQLQVRGKFIFLAVSTDAEAYVSAFASGL